MTDAQTTRMTADEFLSWAAERPGRYELVGGRVVAMAPERARHWRAKGAVYDALRQAVAAAGLPCEAVPDGATVRVGIDTAYEPDALVYCGPRLPGDAVEVPEPVVIVEVLSPGTRRTDTGAKLAAYFALPSVHHYVLIDPDRRVVIHHARGTGEVIETRVLGAGDLQLVPPGIVVAVETLFDDQR